MNYSPTYSDLYDPPFPASTLDLRTELLLGGAWTDISQLTYQRAGCVITRGHPDESTTAQPSSAAWQANNRNGNLSPRNPLGAYFGLLGKNTPSRISVPNGSSYLRIETSGDAYYTCPNSTALNITGDIDIRVDLKPSDYQFAALAGKTNFSSNASWLLERQADLTLKLFWVDSGSSSHIAVSTLPIGCGRLAVRVTLAVATGTVTFYTAPTISGTWTQLGSTVVVGATSIASTTAPVHVGDDGRAPYGEYYTMQLRSGINGTLVASPDFTSLAAGTGAFTDAQGNLWTPGPHVEISDRSYRHHGEVPAWPQRWDNTGQDVYVPVVSAGLLRRLTQGSPPVQSSLYRAYGTLTGSSAPVAYWPCEDGANSGALASALPGGTPMQIQGSASIASNSSFVCSQAIPVTNGSVWSGTVPTAASWSANVVRFLLQVPSGGDTNNAVVARVYTSGTVARADVVYTTASNGSLTLNCYGFNGASLGSSIPLQPILATSTGNGCNGQLMRVDVNLQTSGSSVVAEVAALVVGASASVGVTVTVASASLGAVSQVIVNPAGALTQSAVGHISVQSTFNAIFDLASALSAHLGETAGNRFLRLCNEQGVACRIIGVPSDSVAMGYQSPATFVNLLQQCEDADRGLMYEPSQVLALGYRTRASMLNQAASAALDYSQGHLSPPIEPTDDDQYTQNDVTVTRSSGSVTGSSAREYLASGAMSVQAPPNGVGTYAASLSLNLAVDPQAAQEAGWILHVGTVDEPRYPKITLDLTRSELASMLYTIPAVGIGDRATVANTPVWLPPDGISQVLRGATETLNAYQFTEEWVCAPESPYRVGIYDDATYGRYDTDGSQLAGNISASAVTMLVATETARSPLWTTSAGDFPFDIEVSANGAGGERMTVTNITGAGSPQTFTVTRSVNGVVRSWTTGADIRLFQPAIYSL